MISKDIEELRSELGDDKRQELEEAYYESGLSLLEIKELYNLPVHLRDGDILKLLPDIVLDQECPICGNNYLANHMERGSEGATSSTYHANSVRCWCCNKTKSEIDSQIKEQQNRKKIEDTYNCEPAPYDWSGFAPDTIMDIVFETLVATKGILGNTYLETIQEEPIYSGFIDSCRSLYKSNFIEPVTNFENSIDGYGVEQDGSTFFYYYRVPFAIDIKHYEPIPVSHIETEGGREIMTIFDAQYMLWKQIACDYVMAYAAHQMYQADYEDEGKRRDEFVELLPQMLRLYSPAQITSLIWNAMAAAEKQASEGPFYKQTGAYAYGVILNRARKALDQKWILKPNIPSMEIEESFFEKHFFKTHVPLGETWIYRSIPPRNDDDWKVYLEPAILPPGF